MNHFEQLQNFVGRAKRAPSLDELRALLAQVGAGLGFDYFALAHHVDLGRPPGDAVLLTNYPAGWLNTILERRYYVDDPVFAASQSAAAGFLWEEVGSLIRLSERQKRILLAARRQGVGAGFTVPINLRGEPGGSCSFAVRSARCFPKTAAAAAQSIGWFAFEAARRLTAAHGRRARGRVSPLTARQLDCLVLIAKGKSDSVIGQLLGLSPRTVNGYIEDAKRRHAVASRQQLLVSALWEGQVTFEDMLS